MSFKLEQRLALNCTVCGHDRSRLEDAETDLALFGQIDLYAVCPSCSREIIDPQRSDPEYRRLVRMEYFRRTGRVPRST